MKSLKKILNEKNIHFYYYSYLKNRNQKNMYFLISILKQLNIKKSELFSFQSLYQPLVSYCHNLFYFVIAESVRNMILNYYYWVVEKVCFIFLQNIFRWSDLAPGLLITLCYTIWCWQGDTLTFI